ncbi:MAG TPA: DUF4097 family beta strand repeat-containing protein [Ktedonobacteraceae bacterium]
MPLMRSRRHIVLLLIILLIVLLLAVALSVALLHKDGQDTVNATGTGPQSFAVGSKALLVVKEQSGNISVYPSHNNLITVTPRKSGTTLAPDDHSVRILLNRTTNAQGQDQLNVSTDPWFSNTDFYITIPDTTLVQIAVNAGSIDVHTGHGLNASTSSGSIALEDIQGPTSIHTDSGDITASTINGDLTVSDSSGSLRLHGINGQVNAKTWSGDVIVQNSTLKGHSLLQTQNGSVRFDGSIDPAGSYTMQTTSGDVDLTLPNNAAFLLTASTGSGNVQNAFGVDTVGATPRAQLILHTQNGSIAIAKAT